MSKTPFKRHSPDSRLDGAACPGALFGTEPCCCGSDGGVKPPQPRIVIAPSAAWQRKEISPEGVHVSAIADVDMRFEHWCQSERIRRSHRATTRTLSPRLYVQNGDGKWATSGYVRVSTEGQSLDGQLTQLRAAVCTRVFREKIGGPRIDRSQLERLIKIMMSSQHPHLRRRRECRLAGVAPLSATSQWAQMHQLCCSSGCLIANSTHLLMEGTKRTWLASLDPAHHSRHSMNMRSL